MEKIIVALFKGAHGSIMVNGVVEYRTTPQGRRYAEIEAREGGKYLAYLDEIVIKAV